MNFHLGTDVNCLFFLPAQTSHVTPIMLNISSPAPKKNRSLCIKGRLFTNTPTTTACICACHSRNGFRQNIKCTTSNAGLYSFEVPARRGRAEDKKSQTSFFLLDLLLYSNEMSQLAVEEPTFRSNPDCFVSFIRCLITLNQCLTACLTESCQR